MLPHIDIHILNILIYTTTSARVSFHAITITYIHLHILPYMDVHILYILIYTTNVNTCFFLYYNNYIYSFMRQQPHGFLSSGSPVLCTYSRDTRPCLSIPSALHFVLDRNFRFTSPNYTNEVSLES